MMISRVNSQTMVRPRMQNQSLQKIIGQINANLENKSKCDTVEISKKALDFLDKQNKIKETNEAEDSRVPADYKKYPDGMFTKEEWSEQSVLSQRSGIQTVSDIIEHAKSKLEYTTLKIEELQNYLNGTSSHSDPNMTKELAETYLHNYKQSIQTDYSNIIKQHLGHHKYLSNEYDQLSGGMASDLVENVLDSISADSLGLDNLSSDPNEIMEALDNASKILNEKMSDLEDDFIKLTGKDGFTESARSTYIFDGNSSLSFFTSRMENPYKLASVDGGFNGQRLNL